MSRRGAVLAILVAAACSRTKQVRGPEGEPREPAQEVPQEGRGTGAGVPPAPGRPRIPAAPQGLLARGVVAEIQRALARRGLLREHREGELDPPTTAAVRRFQQAQGLAATGFPDRETLKNLGIDPERAYVREEDRKRAEGERGGDRR